MANDEARKIFPNGDRRFCDGLRESLKGRERGVLVTRWAEFQQVPKLLASLNPQPLVVDGRRMLDKKSVAHYAGIGL